MSLTISMNLEAMNAQRNLNATEGMLGKAMQQLSSGLRINSAADDVAGYAISQRLQGQVNGLNQAAQRVSIGRRVAVETAEGSLNDVTQMLQRIRVVPPCSTPTVRPPRPTRRRSSPRPISLFPRSTVSVKRLSSMGLTC